MLFVLILGVCHLFVIILWYRHSSFMAWHTCTLIRIGWTRPTLQRLTNTTGSLITRVRYTSRSQQWPQWGMGISLRFKCIKWSSFPLYNYSALLCSAIWSTWWDWRWLKSSTFCITQQKEWIVWQSYIDNPQIAKPLSNQ